MRRRAFLSLLATAPLLTAGCPAVLFGTGAVVGAGALVWQSGWLRGNISEPIERVHRAAKSAVRDLKVVIERDEVTSQTGTVDGTMPDGRRVVVETKALAPKETQIRIRVGLWGDQDVSLRIYEQMKKHL